MRGLRTVLPLPRAVGPVAWQRWEPEKGGVWMRKLPWEGCPRCGDNKTKALPKVTFGFVVLHIGVVLSMLYLLSGLFVVMEPEGHWLSVLITLTFGAGMLYLLRDVQSERKPGAFRCRVCRYEWKVGDGLQSKHGEPEAVATTPTPRCLLESSKRVPRNPLGVGGRGRLRADSNGGTKWVSAAAARRARR